MMDVFLPVKMTGTLAPPTGWKTVCFLLVSGQQDGVVRVPAEGAVSAGVGSVVHMVGAGVTRRGSVRITGGGGQG